MFLACPADFIRYIKLLHEFNCSRWQLFVWLYIWTWRKLISSHKFLDTVDYVIWGFELLLDFNWPALSKNHQNLNFSTIFPVMWNFNCAIILPSHELSIPLESTKLNIFLPWALLFSEFSYWIIHLWELFIHRCHNFQFAIHNHPSISTTQSVSLLEAIFYRMVSGY